MRTYILQLKVWYTLHLNNFFGHMHHCTAFQNVVVYLLGIGH